MERRKIGDDNLCLSNLAQHVGWQKLASGQGVCRDGPVGADGARSAVTRHRKFGVCPHKSAFCAQLGRGLINRAVISYFLDFVLID